MATSLRLDETDSVTEYQMPTIPNGSVVAYFPTGLQSGPKDVGFVYRVNQKNVYLYSATKGVRTAVPHVSDPRLKLNPEQREAGAWDFTDADKARAREIEDMRTEIEELRELVTKIPAKKKGPFSELEV